jgi:DNA-binding transcriptional MerR regulator
MKRSDRTRDADFWTRGQIMKWVRLSTRQIQYWDETGLLIPRLKTKRRRYYDFANLVEFRMVEALRSEGFSTQKIRRFMTTLKRMMPREESLLARLQIHTDGRTLIFQEKGSYFDISGQGLLKVDLEKLYHQVRPADLSRSVGTRERGKAIQRPKFNVQGLRRAG